MTRLPDDTMTVSIDRLQCFARHGVGEQERIVGNDFEVTVRLEIPPVYSDNLSDTINYADIVETIKDEMSRPSALLEYVAVRIREAFLRRFPTIRSGSISISKLTPPIPGARMSAATVTLDW